MTEIEERLTPEQLASYRDYKRVLNEVISKGDHPYQRYVRALGEMQPVDVRHCVLFAHPYDLDKTCGVLRPNGHFVAQLMHGGIHPPIAAYLNQRVLIVSQSGEHAVVSKVDEAEWCAKNGPVKASYVIDNRQVLTEVEGSRTYEQAVEYVVMKDLPVSVWGGQHNQRQFMVVKKASLPDRSNRNSWKLADMELAA